MTRQCPQAGVTEEKLIPLFGRGGVDRQRTEDDAPGLPARPGAQPEPVRTPAEGGVALPAFDAQIDQDHLAVSFGLFPALWQLTFSKNHFVRLGGENPEHLKMERWVMNALLVAGTSILIYVMLLD